METKILKNKFVTELSGNTATGASKKLKNEAGEDVGILLWKRYQERRKEWGNEIAEQVERHFALRCIDRNWTGHIDTMDKLREGIHLRSYANMNPLQAYVNEGYQLFGDMLDLIAIEVVLNLLNAQVQVKKPEENEEEGTQEEGTDGE